MPWLGTDAEHVGSSPSAAHCLVIVADAGSCVSQYSTPKLNAVRNEGTTKQNAYSLTVVTVPEYGWDHSWHPDVLFCLASLE